MGGKRNWLIETSQCLHITFHYIEYNKINTLNTFF